MNKLARYYCAGSELFAGFDAGRPADFEAGQLAGFKVGDTCCIPFAMFLYSRGKQNFIVGTISK